MENAFVFDLDPVLLSLGPFQIRYYGVIFASMLYLGFLMWRQQMLRGGHTEDLANQFFIWGVLAVLIGSRLGHCFFYEPTRYLRHPLEIFKFWKGGLSSHGATIALVISLVWFAMKQKLHPMEVLDRFAMTAAIGAAAVRLGNFLNSEIVGRETTVAWAVRFNRFDDGRVARHPSQLYEFTMGLLILLLLYLADRWAGRERRPLGLMASLFFVLYFSGRFAVEFFKEYQGLDPAKSPLTEGQYLSILPILAGLAMLAWTLHHARQGAASALQPAAPAPASGGKRNRQRDRK